MLTIRDRRVHQMARQLAERRGVTMTEAVAGALEKELAAQDASMPLAQRLVAIGRASAAKAKAGGALVTRDDIDAMWSR